MISLFSPMLKFVGGSQELHREKEDTQDEENDRNFQNVDKSSSQGDQGEVKQQGDADSIDYTEEMEIEEVRRK